MTQQTKYKRVLLKLSGEALMGKDAFGINRDTIMQIVGQVKEIVDLGVQVGVVVGGGKQDGAVGDDRVQIVAGQGDSVSGTGTEAGGIRSSLPDPSGSIPRSAMPA